LLPPVKLMALAPEAPLIEPLLVMVRPEPSTPAPEAPLAPLDPPVPGPPASPPLIEPELLRVAPEVAK
jgi:hypothetical protein